MGRFIIGVLAAWACMAGVAWGEITPFIVEDSGSRQLYPNVGGTLVVWQEFIDGGHAVRGKDLATGITFLIDEPNATELAPVTNGSLVVWRDNRTGYYKGYAQDVQSGQQWAVVDGASSQIDLAVGENFVVWNDFRHGRDFDIYALDLRTGQEFRVAAGWDASVSGDTIVWQGVGKYGEQTCGYEVTSGREFRIPESHDGARQLGAVVSGNIVVWYEWENWTRIQGYDVDANMPIAVCLDPYDKRNPDIDGRYVVWVDPRSGTGTDIWGFDLLTGEEFPIYQGPGNQSNPKISGDLVVWYSDIPGEPGRIWAAYIPEPASVALLALCGALLAVRPRRQGRRG